MRVMVVVLALLLWVLPALAEQKSAPDGFGPIKFGMTKEEAWEAIGGQGEWRDDDILVHKEGLPSFLSPFYQVRQGFFEGRASTVIIENPDETLPFSGCATHMAFILGILTDKYGVHPVRADFEREEDLPSHDTHVNIYQFYFQNESYILASLYKIVRRPPGEPQQTSCRLAVQYVPSQEGFSGGF